MTYQANFKGWSELTLADLVVAYRKAKTDCFFENGFPTAIKFAEFEKNLLRNLEGLLDKLIKDKGFEKNVDLLGYCRLVPKKLGSKPKPDSSNGHTHFSDPEKAFEHLCANHNLKPEFRIVGDFPVETHILSALWINMIGHKFDACLDERSYGSRLKRIRDDETLDKEAPKNFHLTATGSFEQYFRPYQKWRNDGLKAVRSELEQDRQVVVASLDLKSFYHLIDPTFIASASFQNEIGLDGDKSLSKYERDFTNQLATMLASWAKKAQDFAKELQFGKTVDVNGGLAIGLSASRIIGNVLLKKWDDLVREKLTPVHYGRYVDDMFLVLHDPGTIHNPEEFMEFVKARMSSSHIKKIGIKAEGIWEIKLGKNYQRTSKIQLQADKQKLFILKGQAGCDLLDSIEKEIQSLSSEHRLMPSPDQLDRSTAAKVLSAAGKVGEEADTLRRADGLTIKRLSWSLQLRLVHTLARDLPSSEWKTEREEFYQFAHNHILRADNIFAHYQYLPRLLGIAISIQDWVQADRIVKASLKAFEKIDENLKKNKSFAYVINGSECKAKDDIWKNIKGSLTRSFIDAAARNYPGELITKVSANVQVKRLAKTFFGQLITTYQDIWDLFGDEFDVHDFHTKAPLLAAADLAAEPYRKLLQDKNYHEVFAKGMRTKQRKALIKEFTSADLLNVTDIEKFLIARSNSTFSEKMPNWGKNPESVIPYLFPTRPYNPAEIAELIPSCLGINVINEEFPLQLWAKYVRALKGVWVKPALLEHQNLDSSKSDDRKTISTTRLRIGSGDQKSVLVCITNLKTENSAWAASACNKPKLTLARYQQISSLVNLAIRSTPKPQYLLFPELSIPIEWVDSIASRLSAAGINMIAGTEYRHNKTDTLHSEACLVLSDDRLGYKSPTRIWQPKLLPAVREEKDLLSKFGKTWKKFSRDEKRKPVYIHEGFHFGVMICSELQNSKARVKFQGEVDALMVLSWNQDLETFSSLIEACALDVHAYTILVNNREYGDSRVRSPAKEMFARDIARLRGGENDFCVTVKLDIDKLRAFQSRATRWPEAEDQFKPVPEGFRIPKGSKRRKLPPQ